MRVSNLKCYPHIFCCYHNVSTFVLSGLHQLFVNPCSLQRILKWINYLINLVSSSYLILFFFSNPYLVFTKTSFIPSSIYIAITITMLPNSRNDSLIHVTAVQYDYSEFSIWSLRLNVLLYCLLLLWRYVTAFTTASLFLLPLLQFNPCCHF